jgi:hypothetical protein
MGAPVIPQPEDCRCGHTVAAHDPFGTRDCTDEPGPCWDCGCPEYQPPTDSPSDADIAAAYGLPGGGGGESERHMAAWKLHEETHR